MHGGGILAILSLATGAAAAELGEFVSRESKELVSRESKVLNRTGWLPCLSEEDLEDLRPYLPPVLNLLAGPGFFKQPLLPPPPIVLDAHRLDYDDELRNERFAYWAMATAGIVVVGAVVSQLVLLLIVEFRKSTRGSYASMHPEVDRWKVPMPVAVGVSILATLYTVFLLSFAAQNDAVSAKTGTAWEIWAAFMLYNTVESFFQAVYRGFTMPLGPETKTFIIDKVITRNVPLLSPRFDLFTDGIFLALVYSHDHNIIFLAGASIWIIVVVRQWFGFPHELRATAMLICAPCPSAIDQHRDVPSNFKKKFACLPDKAQQSLIRKLEDASTPLKLENALLEELPQAVIQACILLVEGKRSLFMMVNVALQCVKILVVLGSMFFILDSGSKDFRMYAFRHLYQGFVRWGIFSVPRSWARGIVAYALCDGYSLGEADPHVLADVLAEATDDFDDYVRFHACKALVKVHAEMVPSENVVEALVKAAFDEDNGVRACACRALGEVHARLAPTEAVVHALVEATADSFPGTQTEACEALGTVHAHVSPTPAVLEALHKAGRGGDAYVRIAAGQALFKIGNADSGERMLLQAAQEKDSFHRVRAFVALDQVHMEAKPSEKVLRSVSRAAQYDRSDVVQSSAREALHKYADRGFIEPGYEPRPSCSLQ